MENEYKLEGEHLEIFTFPAPILKQVAKPVTEFNDELKVLCKNMLFTMYHAPGIGLAAPQIGLSSRIFVIDVDFNREEKIDGEGKVNYEYSDFNPRVFINPEFKNKEGEIVYEEGCLSVPGIYEKVKRFENISLEYQDADGNKHSMDADGLLSICIQHENDHLDGIIFLEKLSPLKQSFLKKKLLKQKKKNSL